MVGDERGSSDGDAVEEQETTAAAEPADDQAQGAPAGEAMTERQPAAGQQPGAAATAGTQRMDEHEARQWALGAHLAGLTSLIGIPGVVGVLVVWLIKKDEHPLVDRHGKEALNFQLSMFIYGFIAFALIFTIIGILIAIPALLILGVLAVVFPIIAAVKTSSGDDYRYPITIRLID